MTEDGAERVWMKNRECEHVLLHTGPEAGVTATLETLNRRALYKKWHAGQTKAASRGTVFGRRQKSHVVKEFLGAL